MGMTISLIFIYLINSFNFSHAHQNILMSGLYQNLLMMVKFVSGRLIVPSKKIEPPKNIYFT